MKPLAIIQSDAFRDKPQFTDAADRLTKIGYEVVVVAPEGKDKIRIEPQATLRDQFAMAALAGLGISSNFQVTARNCWAVADAMMTARDAKEEEKANA